MATLTKKQVLTEYQFGGTPYGNAVVLKYSLETNSSGVWTEGDSTGAIGATDKLRLGVLPAGMRLDDALAIVSDAFRASSTLKVGFEYVDGVDDTDVPQDDDYFFASLALDSAARTPAANTGVRPLILPKDAYLIGTHGGGNAQNVVGKLDLLVRGEHVGVGD